MKTTITPEQIKSITAALLLAHVSPFGQESGDPKYNAQRNLAGKTHYVDDDTLRWHKSRVVSSGHLCGGLLFRVTCSDALDMHNTARGFRTAVFDVWGTCVHRPELENALKTSQKAIAASDATEFDVVAHYRKAIQEKINGLADQQKEYQAALDSIVA